MRLHSSFSHSKTRRRNRYGLENYKIHSLVISESNLFISFPTNSSIVPCFNQNITHKRRNERCMYMIIAPGLPGYLGPSFNITLYLFRMKCYIEDVRIPGYSLRMHINDMPFSYHMEQRRKLYSPM